MRQTIHRHIGVRAEGMILAAGIWLLTSLGIGLGVNPDQPSAWHTLLPVWVRVGLWAVPAVFALTVAASEHLSPYGLAALTVAPVLHLCSHLTAWLVDVIPGPPPGDPAGWYRAGFYLALATPNTGGTVRLGVAGLVAACTTLAMWRSLPVCRRRRSQSRPSCRV